MVLPAPLLTALEAEMLHCGTEGLKAASERLSARYRLATGSLALKNDQEVLAYSLTRMPATFAACLTALQLTAELLPDAPHSQLDVGCGTGAALYAARTLWPRLVQRGEDVNQPMLALAMRLGHAAALGASFGQETLFAEGDKADLVTASYALNELKDHELASAAKALYQRANQLIVIVEPGTPKAFQMILALRQAFLALGGRIIAPCPHDVACPMQEAWCHNGVRLARTRLHKHLKSADAPYEDEPFCYLAVAKPDVAFRRPLARILHKPIDNKTGITFPACLPSGTMADVVVPRRDKEQHRAVRRLGRGDAITTI